MVLTSAEALLSAIYRRQGGQAWSEGRKTHWVMRTGQDDVLVSWDTRQGDIIVV